MKKFLQYFLIMIFSIGFVASVFAAEPPPPPEETPTVEKTVVGLDQACDNVKTICAIGNLCESGRCVNSLQATGASATVDFKTNDYGLGDMGSKLGYSTSGITKDTFLEKVGAGIRVVLGLLGSLVLIMMIYNGFLWMTARGNDKQVEEVKNSLMSLFIGLVVILAAYAVSSFVLTALVNINK